MAPCLMRSWRLRATRHSPPITHTATNLHNTNCCAIVCVLRGSCWPCVVSHLDYILLLQPKRTTTLMVTPTVQGSIPFISVYFYNIKYVRRRRRRSCFLLKRKMKIERNFFFSKIVDADGSSRERGGGICFPIVCGVYTTKADWVSWVSLSMNMPSAFFFYFNFRFLGWKRVWAGGEINRFACSSIGARLPLVHLCGPLFLVF